MFDHGNYDYDHRPRDEGYKKRPRAYGKLRGHECSWARHRKQHRSRNMRNVALRSYNKHVRNVLRQEMFEELN
jgi:hypothetical protein